MATPSPTILFPRPDGRVPATTPVVIAGVPGASVTVAPDVGSPIPGTIDNSGHIRLMVTFTGPGPHTFTATQTVNGSTSAAASGSLVVPAAGDLYTVPAGATAAQISTALATYHYVKLTASTTYAITQSVIVPSGTYFDLAGSTLQLAAGANCYVLRNANEAAGDEQIVILNGVADGNGNAQGRILGSGSYLTDYCGFGTCFTKVNGLWLDNVTPREANSWGHSHWLCDLALYSNVVCDSIVAFTPDPESFIGNADGITGISRRLYIWDVSGYTGDDTIGVATGKVQFGYTTYGPDFYDVGVPDIDTEVVDIRNVTAGSKGGSASWQGIGIYATGGKTHRHVTIDGLHGTFVNFSYRLTDFWTDDALGYLGECHVLNRTSPSGWITAGGAQEIGFAFNAIAHGGGAVLTGWKREDETITSVSVSGGTAGAVSYPAGDPTTWTCPITVSGASASATVQRSGGASATLTVNVPLYANVGTVVGGSVQLSGGRLAGTPVTVSYAPAPWSFIGTPTVPVSVPAATASSSAGGIALISAAKTPSPTVTSMTPTTVTVGSPFTISGLAKTPPPTVSGMSPTTVTVGQSFTITGNAGYP